MKKLMTYLVLPLFWLCSACEEVPPIVSPIVAGEQELCGGVSESLVADQKRKVLIEEFTGVKCVNCPAGSQAIEALVDIHGEQLVVVSIHAGSFAPPYEESLYDFRTEEGDALIDFLGVPFGYPSAVINRKLFEGEFDLQVGRNLWPGFVDQELAAPPMVKIHIARSFDAASRDLSAEVTVFVEEDLSALPGLRLTLLITEGEVADYQLTPAGLREDYVHQHILRRVLTNFAGNQPEGELTAGSRFCNSFTTAIPEAWQESHLELVAFVSLGGEQKDVLQAHKVTVLE